MTTATLQRPKHRSGQDRFTHLTCASAYAQPPVSFDRARARFSKIGELRGQKNWDGYGSFPPTESSLQAAFCSILSMEKYCQARGISVTKQPSFGLSPDGIVGFEWKSGNKTLAVRFENENSLEIFHSFEDSERLDVFEGDMDSLSHHLAWLFPA